MAALFSFEIREALRYLNEPDFYLHSEEIDEEAGKIWLGAADDTVFRKRGVEFVDGSAPGFAAIVGAAPDPETAKLIVEEYQKRSLYIFLAAQQNDTTVAQQLLQAEADRLEHRIVPFGPHPRPSSPWVLPTVRPWPSAGFSPATTSACCFTTRTASSPL
jgi:acetyl-CoA synthase